jgi:hypothetical protein
VGRKIIEFSDHMSPDYREYLETVLDELEEMAIEIDGYAFNLAVKKAWREWDAEQPQGAELAVDSHMLLECPDRRVRTLAALSVRIRDALGELS